LSRVSQFWTKNFQTKRRSYNFSMAHNFGRASCPLPPLPRRQCLPRLCPVLRKGTKCCCCIRTSPKTSTSQAEVVYTSRSWLFITTCLRYFRLSIPLVHYFTFSLTTLRTVTINVSIWLISDHRRTLNQRGVPRLHGSSGGAPVARDLGNRG